MVQRMTFFVAVFACVVTHALGQNGGSVLSRYGIGDLSSFMTARQRSLGGLSTPLQSNQDISQINPASWTMVDGLRVQGDVSYEFETYSKNSNLSIGSTNLSGFQFSVPVQDELRSRVVFGFLPYSRVDYRLQSTGSTNDDPYAVDYLGSGGLSLIRLGTAIRPLPFLHVGAAVQYHFGTIDQQWEIAFSSGERFNTRESRNTSFHGAGFVFGTQIAVSEDLLAGLAFEPAVSLNGSRNVFFQYITHDSTMEGASGELDLPLRFSAGATYMVTPKLMIGADMLMQDWTEARIFDAPQKELGRLIRYGGGIEWQPGRGDMQAGFWRRAAYRIGFSVRELSTRLGGVTETETFVTAGIGIPIFQQNRTDIALEYGWRGSDASMLGPRSILRLSLSISVGEPWFLRRGQE